MNELTFIPISDLPEITVESGITGPLLSRLEDLGLEMIDGDVLLVPRDNG